MAALMPSRLLGIEDLPGAMRLSILQCFLVFTWALPSALLPVQALRILGSAQSVSLFFFGVGFAGLFGVLATPWIIHVLGRSITLWLGMTCLAIASFCLSVEDAAFLFIGAAAPMKRKAASSTERQKEAMARHVMPNQRVMLRPSTWMIQGVASTPKSPANPTPKKKRLTDCALPRILRA